MPVTRTVRNGPTLVAALKDLDGVEGRTGWFKTSHEADGTPTAYVAAIHEFGALVNIGDAAAAFQTGAVGKTVIIIPPRPTMRPTVAAKGAEWLKLLGEGAKAVLEGRDTAVKVMEKVALRAAADEAAAIQALQAPPLAASTIKRKGFAKPLIESGRMLQDVTGVASKL